MIFANQNLCKDFNIHLMKRDIGNSYRLHWICFLTLWNPSSWLLESHVLNVWGGEATNQNCDYYQECLLLFCVFHEREEGDKLEKGRRWKKYIYIYIIFYLIFFLVITSHFTYIFSSHWAEEIINMITSLVLWIKKLNWNNRSMCESDPK